MVRAHASLLHCLPYDSGTVVEKSFSNQKVASSIPCRSVLEQDTEPLIARDVQCAISVNVKNVYNNTFYFTAPFMSLKDALQFKTGANKQANKSQLWSHSIFTTLMSNI